MGMKLTPFGQSIIRRGGHDDQSDDDMLLLELMSRAPGMSKEDYQACFVALRLEYGEDALRAIQTGHVVFEERRGGERSSQEQGETI